jgi:hypothetical protein
MQPVRGEKVPKEVHARIGGQQDLLALIED